MANDTATLVAELERLYQRQADLRAYEIDLAERGENDPASDEWKLASMAASNAEIDFCSALLRNYSTISRVLREAAEGWRPAPKGFKLAWVPDYPEGDVIGACICGSWPGGKCLRCPVQVPPPPPPEAATLSQETHHEDK